MSRDIFNHRFKGLIELHDQLIVKIIERNEHEIRVRIQHHNLNSFINFFLHTLSSHRPLEKEGFRQW